MDPKEVSFSVGGVVRSFKVVHVFHAGRVLIDFEGVFAFADVTPGGWELSGEPARGDEKTVLARFLEPTLDRTVTTVDPPAR